MAPARSSGGTRRRPTSAHEPGPPRKDSREVLATVLAQKSVATGLQAEALNAALRFERVVARPPVVVLPPAESLPQPAAGVYSPEPLPMAGFGDAPQAWSYYGLAQLALGNAAAARAAVRYGAGLELAAAGPDLRAQFERVQGPTRARLDADRAGVTPAQADAVLARFSAPVPWRGRSNPDASAEAPPQARRAADFSPLFPSGVVATVSWGCFGARP